MQNPIQSSGIRTFGASSESKIYGVSILIRFVKVSGMLGCGLCHMCPRVFWRGADR